MAENRSHNFELCGQFDDAYRKLSCETPVLQPIAKAFRRNMNRVHGIGILPLSLTTAAIINQTALIQALSGKGVALDDPRLVLNHPSFDSSFYEEIRTEQSRILEEWIEKWGGEAEFRERTVRMGVRGMNIVIDSNEKQGYDAVQATMAAMLIGLWTAFESLAQDTWISAVDACPEILARNVLADNRDRKMDMMEIGDADFNFQTKMGTFFFRRRVADFQSLKNIRGAYKSAFRDELESIFQTHDLELSRLEAVRNLFAHKGGMIDSKFIQRMGDDLRYKQHQGKMLAVNGEQVAEKANAVSKCATQLIQAVDKWLLENPAKQPSDAASDS